MDMNGTTTVPGEIFDSIRGRDVTVTFDMGGGISWTINGLTITAQKGKTIDFGVATGTKAGKTIPVEVINNVTGERYSINLTFTHASDYTIRAYGWANESRGRDRSRGRKGCGRESCGCRRRRHGSCRGDRSTG